ncbi:hypothetical protein [Pseudobdellovibrio exovorus]|uniref:hypothetical protein n=1 Tax=Pseudobdellovibrio exovorus TaxID=453816 RepID=UPI00034D329C|nr:hypothetical protein [Pseudobdellovibrio exovorus]
MATIQRLQKLLLLGLVFSLVITSHFTILDMMVHCSNHSEWSHDHTDHDSKTAAKSISQKSTTTETSSQDACPAHYKCHTSAFQYFFPTTDFTVVSLHQPLDNSFSNKSVPPSPFIEGPFQPPRA